MFSQDRKYFRFRFSQVLALAFLLISPTQFTQASGMPALPASCVKVAGATVVSVGIFGVQVSLIIKDPEKFVGTFVDCLNELTNEKSWKTAGEFTRRLPELMRKALPVAKKGGLVLLSAYFLYRSFELYDRAMNLAKWDFKKHRDEFKALEEEMIPVRDFMETQLIPQWKKGNYANTQKSGKKLLQMLSRSYTVLGQLVQAIRRDTKKGASDQRWSVFYGVGAIAVCAGSVFVGNIPVMVVTCGGSVGTIAFSVNSYYTLGDTLIKLDTLWEDTTKMRKEVVKCCAQLYIAKMRDALAGLGPRSKGILPGCHMIGLEALMLYFIWYKFATQ